MGLGLVVISAHIIRARRHGDAERQPHQDQGKGDQGIHICLPMTGSLRFSTSCRIVVEAMLKLGLRQIGGPAGARQRHFKPIPFAILRRSMSRHPCLDNFLPAVAERLTLPRR
jgi:hypothetical protein